MKIQKISILILLTLMFTFTLSGCEQNLSTPAQPTSTDLVVMTPLESSTPAQPVETKIPENPKRIFIHLTNSDLYYPDQTALTLLSATISEMGYEVLTGNETPESDQLFDFVLLFSPSPETFTHFQSDNIGRLLIVEEDSEAQPAKPATIFKMSIADRTFIAGYLSAVISDDWRVGGLLPVVDYHGTGADKVFQNGVEFMCGRCSPIYGPIVKFPVTSDLSSPEDNERTLQAFGEISPNKIDVVYIPSAYLFNDLVILLNQSGVTIVSDVVPGQDRTEWVDYAIIDNLSALILEAISEPEQQELLQTLPVEYTVISITNELTPGKSDFVNTMINNLQAGFISPYQITTE